MSTYQLGQKVKGDVERVLPFGVYVRLGDGSHAYVRRRELDLDPDVEPSDVVAVSQQSGFRNFHLHDALTGSIVLSALLERQLTDQCIQSLHALLLSGQLAAGFGHEIFNKLTGLEIQLRNLLRSSNSSRSSQPDIRRSLDLSLDLNNIATALQRMTRLHDDLVQIDVRDVLDHAQKVLHTHFRRYETTIVSSISPYLPKYAGHITSVLQIFLNIMLNSAQQMALIQSRYRLLTIKAITNANGSRIEVRFQGSGCGIHRKDWERIFEPDFSTRRGSGLGLFLARTFARSFSGEICVEDSVIPCGTAFLVELPTVGSNSAA
jgi:signal transduction histidine kinase